MRTKKGHGFVFEYEGIHGVNIRNLEGEQVGRLTTSRLVHTVGDCWLGWLPIETINEASEFLDECQKDEQPTHDFGSGPVPAHRHVNCGGQLGGWVADTASVGKYCLVDKDAEVFENAEVQDFAIVGGKSKVRGNAKVFERACISDYVEISGNAKIHGRTKLAGLVQVCGNADLWDCTELAGNLRVCGDVSLAGTAEIR